ncbi:MAG: hypothetical protein ABEJ40_04005 [Haloarculaceae archaeon]
MSGTPDAESGDEGPESTDVEALRREVEEKYDFDDFGPADMAEMSADEWEAAFDPETWITGEELLDRVESDLKRRVADRDVFARVERFEDRIVAYSDAGYATVHPDGTVEGRGTVLRDVEPTVALCSMEDYDVPEDPPDEALPAPQAVPEGTGELGNRVLQVVAGFQVLAGVVLVAAWLFVSAGLLSPPGDASVRSLNVVGMLVAGFAFLVVGILLFAVVANARLSDKFRAEEYRNRLRAVDADPDELPEAVREELPAAVLTERDPNGGRPERNPDDAGGDRKATGDDGSDRKATGDDGSDSEDDRRD